MASVVDCSAIIVLSVLALLLVTYLFHSIYVSVTNATEAYGYRCSIQVRFVNKLYKTLALATNSSLETFY